MKHFELQFLIKPAERRQTSDEPKRRKELYDFFF